MAIHQAFWLALALLLAGAEQPAEPPAPEPANAESRFQQAFDPKVEPADRRLALERIVKEFRDSKWADDALWALGECARQEGHPRRVAYYWQYLMAVHPEPHLEDFTRSLPIARRSGLLQVELYVRRTGQSYVRCEGQSLDDGRVLLNVKPFSPLPMLVWCGLGHAYEDMGRFSLSLKAFTQAKACAPTGGQWCETYEDSVRRVRAKLSALEVRDAEPGAQPVPVPPPAPRPAVPVLEDSSTSAGDEQVDQAKTE